MEIISKLREIRAHAKAILDSGETRIANVIYESIHSGIEEWDACCKHCFKFTAPDKIDPYTVSSENISRFSRIRGHAEDLFVYVEENGLKHLDFFWGNPRNIQPFKNFVDDIFFPVDYVCVSDLPCWPLKARRNEILAEHIRAIHAAATELSVVAATELSVVAATKSSVVAEPLAPILLEAFHPENIGPDFDCMHLFSVTYGIVVPQTIPEEVSSTGTIECRRLYMSISRRCRIFIEKVFHHVTKTENAKKIMDMFVAIEKVAAKKSK